MKAMYSMVTALFIFAFSLGVIVTDWHHNNKEPVQLTPHITFGPAQFESNFIDMVIDREKVKCQFDPPLKYVTLINHWFDNNEDMYADYILRAEPNDREEIWGWSNCVWQKEDSWAACDIYAVIPKYVYADMNMDTIGHENVHAACGNYHE